MCRGIVAGIMGALLVLAACSGSVSSPSEACTKGIDIYCSRVYSCANGAQLSAIQAVLGQTSADCATYLKASANCATVTCQLNQTFSASNANACIDAYNAATCTDILTSGFKPASCNNVCQ